MLFKKRYYKDQVKKKLEDYYQKKIIYGSSTEDEMNRKYNLWKCSQCNYSSKTFVEFIPKKSYKTINQNKELKNDDDIGENDMEIKLKNEESNENDDNVYYYDNIKQFLIIAFLAKYQINSKQF